MVTGDYKRLASALERAALWAREYRAPYAVTLRRGGTYGVVPDDGFSRHNYELVFAVRAVEGGQDVL